MWLTEVCYHKSFSMDVTPGTLDWIRKSFKLLLDNPTNRHFFIEKRYVDSCMWLRKTKNKSKSGNTAEIFKINNKGRKCSILILERNDKKGWKSFLLFIAFTPYQISKRPCSSLSRFYDAYHLSCSDSEIPKKTYADVLSDNGEDENKKKKSICFSNESSRKESSTLETKKQGASGNSLNLKAAVIITKRYFHDDWSRIMFSFKRQT